MDVRLPDGTVVTGVPDGTTRAQLVTRLKAGGHAVPAEWLGESKPANVAPMERPDAASGSYNLRVGPLDTGVQMSENVGNFLAGAGQNLQGLLTGLSQYLPGGATRQEVANQRTLDADLNNRKAGVAGNLLSNVPLALLPGGATAKGATMTGLGLGLMQPSASSTETVGNAALGAAGGRAGHWVGGKVSQLIAGRGATPHASANVGPSNASATANVTATPTINVRNTAGPVPVGPDPSAGLTLAQREAMGPGVRLGMRMTPGQATGSKVLQQVEAKLESQPITSGTFFDIKNNNQRVLNRAVANEMGENADNLAPSVLDDIYSRMETNFDAAADNVTRAIDPDDFLARLARIEQEYDGLLPSSLADLPLVRRYFDLTARGATGEQLHHIQSQLGKLAQSSRTSDPQLAGALRDVQRMALDDMAEGLAPDVGAAFNAARKQYRTYATTVDKPAVLNPGPGNVSGPNLANALQRSDRTGYALGRNHSDMYDAARFSKAFQALVGDSGTATRSPNNMFEAAVAIPMNVMTRAYTSQPAVNTAVGVSNALNNGLFPNSLSPTQANAMIRALGLTGALGGVESAPLVFGN